LSGTFGTLAGGDHWVPMSLKSPVDIKARRPWRSHDDLKKQIEVLEPSKLVRVQGDQKKTKKKCLQSCEVERRSAKSLIPGGSQTNFISYIRQGDTQGPTYQPPGQRVGPVGPTRGRPNCGFGRRLVPTFHMVVPDWP
jgi:hypothetical protein